MADDNPSAWDSILRRLRAKTDAEKADAGRDVADAANAALPESLSAREAVLKQRKREKELDDLARGG